jgi:hypothetical protein
MTLSSARDGRRWRSSLDLFTTIAGADRAVAEKCFHIALEPLVHTEEFGLARSFLRDPRKDAARQASKQQSLPQRSARKIKSPA